VAKVGMFLHQAVMDLLPLNIKLAVADMLMMGELGSQFKPRMLNMKVSGLQ